MRDEINKESQTGGNGHLGRRRFVAATAVGAAAAWAAPTVLSMQSAAAQSVFPLPPDPITTYQGYDGPTGGNSVRRIKPTTGSGAAPLATGDLWLCIVSYYGGTTLTNLPAPVSGVQQIWNISQGTGIYSVKSWLIARVLQAGDVVGGVYTPPATYQSGNDPATYGALRASAIAYRDPNGGPLVLPAAAEVAQNSGTGNVSFPALGTTPAIPNKVVRLGSVRGYGGLDIGGPIAWTSIPGTSRDHNASGNHGDRAIAIGDVDDDPAGSASGTWNKAGAGAGDQNWTGFTVAILGV